MLPNGSSNRDSEPHCSRASRAVKQPRESSARAALSRLTRALTPCSEDLASSEAELALTHILGIDRHRLYTDASIEVLPGQRRQLDELVQRRSRGEPLAYVLGAAYFFGVRLSVDRSVLIPRPDTEALVDTVLRACDNQPRMVLDMGTGSGAIAAALLANRTHWHAVATDISAPALSVARRNLPSRCSLVRADRLEATKGPFDVLVSNPPYVTAEEMTRLDPGVRDWEPHGALCGGCDGLEYYRYISCHGRDVLRPGGQLFVEIGYTQSAPVTALLTDTGDWENTRVVQDLAGRPRVVCATRPA